VAARTVVGRAEQGIGVKQAGEALHKMPRTPVYVDDPG
jgi:hypothetical protein